MQESLNFYIKLSDDTNKRLAKEIEEHNAEVKELKQENATLKQELKDQESKFVSMIEDNRREINLMKNQMLSVYGQVCLNFKCTERKLTKEDVIEKQN
jgi:septal ring factor EnvC (AmiA/AmiB activator)